jgi:hypothetical protein
MSGSLIPTPQQWFDNNGNPLAGGKIYTYISGTTTPKTSYTDYALGSANANPVLLDANGRASVWGNGGYKIVVKTSADATLYTQDNVFLVGSVIDGGLTVTNGGIVQSGGSNSFVGTFTVDHSNVTSVTPVVFTHSNVFSNSDPYGSGAFRVYASGVNNNQPCHFIDYIAYDTSIGNVGPVIRNLAGSQAGVISTTAIAATYEIVANNPKAATVSGYNLANGKFEIGSVSGRDAGNADLQDGYFYISPRRGPLNPSGVNTGFDGNIFSFLPATAIGRARFLTQGSGIEVVPKYDYSADSEFIFTDVFHNSIWTNKATLSGKYARIENQGMSDTYIRTRSQEGRADVYVQSDTSVDAAVQIRANWLTPGTGSSVINLYTDNTASAPTGFVIMVNGTNGRLNIRQRNAGTLFENIDVDPANAGLVSIYRSDDYSKGRLRLGNASGTKGGGLITWDSNTGILDITGTDGYITMGGGGLVQPTRLVTTAAASYTVTNESDVVRTGVTAAFTLTLPTTPADGYRVTFGSVGGITTLTIAGGSATVNGGPTTMAANAYFTLKYDVSTTSWYRLG